MRWPETAAAPGRKVSLVTRSAYVQIRFSHQKDTGPLDEIVLDDIVSGHRGQDLQLRRQADRMFDVATFERTRERDRKLCAALSLIKGPESIDNVLRQLVSEGLVRQVERAELKAEPAGNCITSGPGRRCLIRHSGSIQTGAS